MRRMVLLLAFWLFICSGCRGIGDESPSQRAVAQMLAIDRRGEEYQVTVRMLSQDGAPDSYQSVSETGETISGAVSAMENRLGKELFLRDTRLILLGSGVCENGIGTCRRYLTDGFEIRPRAVMAVTEGSAGNYLQAEKGMAAPADELLPVLQWSAGGTGAGTTVLELDREMNASGGDGYLPLLRMDASGKAELTGGQLLHKEKTSRRIGQEEMDGVRLLFLEPRGITLTAELMGAQAVVKLTSCRRTLRAEIKEERPVFAFKGSYGMELLEWTGAGTPPEEDALETALEERIKALLEKAIRLSVFDAGCDLLQMDSTLRRDAPLWWEQNELRWRENREESVFTLQVRCNITMQEP